MPFPIIAMKLCIKFGISHDMIKSLSYNDLLFLIIDFQKDEIENYLESKKDKNKEVVYPDETEVTQFLCGKIPQAEVK